MSNGLYGTTEGYILAAIAFVLFFGFFYYWARRLSRCSNQEVKN